MASKRNGSMQIIISSMFFGALPLLTKIGYDGGANAETMLAIRFILASVLVWGYLLLTRTRIKVTLKELVVFALVAVFGFGMMAYTYFNAFYYIPSSMAAMIMFCYPAVVTFASSVMLKSRITRAKIIALIMVTGGAIVMSWGDLAFNLKGILFALASMLLYSIYILYLGSKYTFNKEPKVLTGFIILFVAIFFIIFGSVRGQINLNIQNSSWIAALAMAIFSTFLAIMLFYAGVKKIGPAVSSIISTMEPLTAVFLGVFILHEQLKLVQWLGALLIILGVIYVQIPGPKPKIDWKSRI